VGFRGPPPGPGWDRNQEGWAGPAGGWSKRGVFCFVVLAGKFLFFFVFVRPPAGAEDGTPQKNKKGPLRETMGGGNPSE